MNAYGASFATDDPIEVEITAIRLGGRWQRNNGKHCGAGLFHHYKALQSHLAPWKQWDRWSDRILQELISRPLVVLTGPANSTKTHNVAFYALCRYIVAPTQQCVLVSSTDSRSLELRIWGEIKKLWSGARKVYGGTPGRIVESRQMIVTDIEDSEATDFRNGILAIPTVIGGNYVGLGKWAGIKNDNIFMAADEVHFMGASFYDAIANLRKNRGFQCAASGNPKDRTDVLGRLGEPASSIGGWEGYEPTGKTFTYPTRFAGGIAICLDGRDSPNNDVAPGDPVPFPYIITQEKIQEDLDYYGEDSIQVSMMDYGIFPKDAQAKRVITRSLCEKFRAFEDVTWTHEPLVKLFCMDAAYGAVGGDRCVGIEMHMGRCADGVQRLAFAGNPMVIPVSAKLDMLPEDQIATFVKNYCSHPERDIPPRHVIFDSTGRGSLVSAFGRLWSSQVVPVEFGGMASERPVSAKIKTPCRAFYFNFVSELWYQVRHVIEADQLRRLPINVMEEGAMRGYELTAGNRVKVEPKEECKVRMGRSPDLFDAFVCGAELALRLGFVIRGISKDKHKTPAWIKTLVDQQQQVRKAHELTYK